MSEQSGAGPVPAGQAPDQTTTPADTARERSADQAGADPSVGSDKGLISDEELPEDLRPAENPLASDPNAGGEGAGTQGDRDQGLSTQPAE